MTGAGAGGAGADAAEAEAPAELPEAVPVPAAALAERSRWLVGVLVGLITAALVLAGGGIVAVTGIGRQYVPGDDSVDAGFVRDMIVHHEQAVEMAQVVRDHGTDPALRLIAFDIETQQLGQVGEMRGWLESWGLSEQTSRAHMAWMGDAGHLHDTGGSAIMPGMASTAELDRLHSLSGPALDVLFLQLMIRHHQGALPMAQYGQAHARVDYVRVLAAKVFTAQTGEIVTMEQLLRERGGSPLPSP